jgi:hypothetical protein
MERMKRRNVVVMRYLVAHLGGCTGTGVALAERRGLKECIILSVVVGVASGLFSVALGFAFDWLMSAKRGP